MDEHPVFEKPSSKLNFVTSISTCKQVDCPWHGYQNFFRNNSDSKEILYVDDLEQVLSATIGKPLSALTDEELNLLEKFAKKIEEPCKSIPN